MRHLLKNSFFIILSFIIIGSVLMLGHVQNLNRNIADGVLRLHVVANSDSPEDQAVKLKVRDSVLAKCGYLFSGCKTAEESADRALTYANILRRTAQDELRKNGNLSAVSVEVGKCMFPTKAYGNIRLPAGSYSAINIKIGAAAGQNWWCVMYPPLCLTSDTVKADENTLALLRRELSAEEYALITETDELQINVKFRLAEILGKYLGGNKDN